MSSKTLSPTAKLLRSSRVFSLPPALPKLSDPSQRSAMRKDALSSTSPYPVQQAITAPSSSLSKGDWGLKRALPIKSSRTSTPLVRINALDTYEHITDYESASDLTLTLHKLIELAIPVVYDQSKNVPRMGSAEEVHGVFEDATDNTDPAVDAAKGKSRWKYQGPWLPGMVEGEFRAYIKKELLDRQPEFLAFLREHYEQQRRAELRSKNRDQGKDIESGMSELNVTDADFREYVLEMRKHYTLSSEIARLVSAFLDLPNAQQDSYANVATMVRPPRQHPSAGLSYLRTGMRVENHPLFGPQDDVSPVQGRVIRKSMHGRKGDGYHGIAGVVTAGNQSARLPVKQEFDAPVGPEVRSKETNSQSPGFYIKGGNKMWYAPRDISIDENGKLKIRAQSASPQAVGVKTEDYDLPVRDRLHYARPRMHYIPPAGGDKDNMGGIKRQIERNLSLPSARK